MTGKNAHFTGKLQGNSAENKKAQDKGGKAVISCNLCGKKYVRSREKCPERGKSCSKCGEKNHFAFK